MRKTNRLYRLIPTYGEIMDEGKGTATQIPSFDEVMSQAPTPKKKEDFPLLYNRAKTGGLAGVSSGLLKEKVPKTKTEDIWDRMHKEEITGEPVQPPAPQINNDDPVGSIRNKIIEKTAKFGNVKSESTAQKYLSAENQTAIDAAREQPLLPSMAVKLLDEVKDEIFPTTKNAEFWLDNHIQQNNGNVDEYNATATVAKQMIEDKAARTNAIENNNLDIGRAAVEYYGSLDDLTGEKIRTMREKGPIPKAMEGNLVYDFLNSKGVKEWSSESPQNKIIYEEQKQNLFTNYPDIRKQMILSKIAQGREDFGYNNPILNLVGKKSSDEIINTLVSTGELSEFDKRFYENEIRPHISGLMKEIPTPGMVETFYKSGKEAILDVPKSLMDITGISSITEDKADRIYEETKADYTATNVEFKGVNKVSDAIGNLSGIVIPIGGEAKIIQALGLVKNATNANRLMQGLTFYHSLYEQNLREMPNDEWGAHIAALMQTAVYDRISKVLPNLAKNVTEEISPTVKNIVERLADNKITGAAAAQELTNTVLSRLKSGADVLGTAAKKNVEMATQMGLATEINGTISDIFSGRNNADNNLKNAAATFETMLLGGGPLSLIAARGAHKKVTADMYNEIAERPEYFAEQIKKLSDSDPEFAKVAPQYLENLKHLTDIHNELKVREDLSPDQKKKFQVLALSQRMIENKIKTSPNKALNEKDQKDLAAIEIEQKKVLNPEMGSREFMEEMYDEDLIPKSDRVHLEVDGKFSPAKVGDYLKYIAQQSNNLSENWTPHEGKAPTMENYPEQIIELANERWAKEIEAATKPQNKKVSIILPEENKVAENIPLIKTEKDALPIKEPEALPVDEAPGSRPEMEQGIPESKEPPPAQEKSKATGEEEVGGITHAANEVRRQDRGLPEYERSPETFEQWNNEAEKLLKEGYDVEGLMNRMEKDKHDPTPVENAIRKIYIATIDAEIAKNPTDALLAKQKRFAEIGDLANSRAGKNLVSLKGEGSPLNSISDFYVAKMEAAGVNKLTDQQKKETKEAFDNVQKADENATAAMEAYREEISKLKAENELLKQKKEATHKKEKGDWAQQRKDAVQGARDALKKLRTGESGLSAVPLPGIRELIAIAPHVKKYVGSLLGEGVYNLKEVVSKAYNEFKDILEGVTEKDIHNILAGEFNEPRQTRNELAAKMRDIKDEAFYINKLERLLKGEEPKKENAKQKRNKEITDLQQKIKELQKELPPTEAELKKKLEAIKNRNEKEAENIKERIKKGDFAPKKEVPFLENREMQKKFPKEYKAAIDAIIKKEDARHEFDIALLKDEMSKRSFGEKGIDLAGDVIGTTKALVTGIDASGIGIQNLVAMIAHPRSAAKSLPASFGDFFSAKNQERWLASVHSSESFPLAKKAGLDITEPQSLKSSEKEEIFTHNLLDRGIKFKGKKYIISKYTTKPFERIFTGLGNRMRWNLWTRGVEKLYSEGYTWESHPEEFKSLAKVLNTETGRGKLHPQIDKAFNLVSAGIWSPRLMASRMNILGLGDLGNLIAGGKKGYYGGLTPKMREYALKDLAKFVVFGTALMGLAGLTFAEDVDLDPNSSTFGSFLVNGKRYNIWGGFTQYVRLIAKYIAGGEKTGGGFRKSDVLETSGRFLWSKTTPAVGTAIGWFNKDDRTGIPEDYMGKPMTISGSAESLIIPLSIRGIIKGVEKEGAGSILWTGVPSFVGLNVSYESDFKKNPVNKQTKSQGRPERQSRPQQTNR